MKIENKPLRVQSASASARPAKTTAVKDSGAVLPASAAGSILGIPPEEMTPKVKSAIMTLLREVEELRSEVNAAQARLAELEKIADLDPLAPIANRRAFVRELSRTISYAERYNVPTSLIYFDVNDLKKINDTYGHAGGDTVLVHVANTLMTNLRGSDMVGRLGGDEFAILLVQADENEAHEKAAQLAKIVAETPPRFEGISIPVRIAYGAYTFKPGEKASDVLARADKRMYQQKTDSKARPHST
jgi:diguanylate cyclase (GGDEF)-like protein